MDLVLYNLIAGKGSGNINIELQLEVDRWM